MLLGCLIKVPFSLITLGEAIVGLQWKPTIAHLESLVKFLIYDCLQKTPSTVVMPQTLSVLFVLVCSRCATHLPLTSKISTGELNGVMALFHVF